MSVRVRRSGAERKREIACAALAIIGEEGLPALTTARLAAAVELSTGGIFRHFASMEEILEEMVRCALERMGETFPAEDLPPRERIAKLARARIRTLGSEPGLAWLFRSEQVPLVLPAAAVAGLTAVADRTRKYLLRALADGGADGTLRSDLPPEILLVPVLGTIHALIGSSGVHGRRRAGRDHTEEVLSGLLTLLTP